MLIRSLAYSLGRSYSATVSLIVISALLSDRFVIRRLLQLNCVITWYQLDIFLWEKNFAANPTPNGPNNEHDLLSPKTRSHKEGQL